MEEVIRVKDRFYVLATSTLADDRTRVLKYGDTFAVFDRYGDIEPIGGGKHGIYHEETRYLSRMIFRLGKERPLLLSSTVKEENAFLAVDLTNLDISTDGQLRVPRGTLHLFRSKFLLQGICYERLRISNFSLQPVRISFSYQFEADFADIFEVRGMKRERKGERLADKVEDGSVVLSYNGLDGVLRRTRLDFSPKPQDISQNHARFEAEIEPRQDALFLLTVCCECDGKSRRPEPYQKAFDEVGRSQSAARLDKSRILTSSARFDTWLRRSEADLHMMIVGNPEGAYPYAGVPWFNTVFGRDGIITAMECLWVQPEIAKGVLQYLAKTQADCVVPEQDAEPGKILHEMRKGEMAKLKEVPFGRYYGSVDATPLFVMLAGAYYERTADADFIRTIWVNIERALEWIDKYGDSDGDGFVEYSRRSKKGLIQQGWKDSHDSVFHADGTMADPPIALCEVQAYVYAAKRAAALLALTLGRPDRAAELSQQAKKLQENFERAFWCEELCSYVLALDGNKKQCCVGASNAGHCLFAGIASEEHARHTAETLLGADLFSGWGVRTLGAKEARYNPMSYHNGSVWPHDNALIARGLARYGLNRAAVQILDGMYEASVYLDLHRLPELFCGFRRRPDDGPTLYPVACSPQAWSAAAVYMLLEACLGLSIDGPGSQIRFSSSCLPGILQHVRIENLSVAQGLVDLVITRQTKGVGIEVARREGDVTVALLK